MKPTPQDHEAEAAVLAGVLLRPDVMTHLAWLPAADFGHPGHRAVWAACLALHERRQAIDPVTLADRLRATDELALVGGMDALGRLADRYASSHHAPHHARIVADVARRRRVVQACRLVADSGLEAVDDEQAWLETAERQVLEAGALRSQVTHERAGPVVNRTMEAIRARVARRDPIVGIPSGVDRLDRLIGGFQAGKLYVVAGRPGHGKSALAGNVASRAGVFGRGGRVWPSLTINLEMTPEEVMERHVWDQVRTLPHDPGIHDRIRAGNPGRGDWQAMVQAADRLHGSPVAIVDGAGMGSQEIVSQAKRWRHGPDCGRDQQGLVVVDYLQLIRPPRGNGRMNREQEVATISRDLKLLAKEEQIPVLLLCQLNRKVDDRPNHRPVESDLRESGAIEQDADVIIFVYRPVKYMEPGSPEAEASRDKAEIVVAKHRAGDTGIVHCQYLGPYLSFVDEVAQ